MIPSEPDICARAAWFYFEDELFCFDRFCSLFSFQENAYGAGIANGMILAKIVKIAAKTRMRPMLWIAGFLLDIEIRPPIAPIANTTPRNTKLEFGIIFSPLENDCQTVYNPSHDRQNKRTKQRAPWFF